MHKLQRTVLLVDDVKEDRVLIRRALRRDPKVDYQVLEAENGAQALAYLHELQPDCLLLDYKLPDTDGVTLLKTVVEQAAPHIYPVVMLTNMDRTAVVVETMQQGAHDFLPKAAFSAEHLHQAISNATEKVALLRQLDEQREWFRLTLASISDGVIATDEAGYVTFMNPVAETLTGWTVSEAQGQALDQLLHAIDEATRQSVMNVLTQTLHIQPMGSKTSSALLTGRDGRQFPIDYSVAPIPTRQNQMNGVVLTFRDVSERKAAEAALQISEEFNRTVLESSPDCVKVLDAEGCLLMMNKPGLALMEIDDFSPLYGQPWTQLWPAECAQQIHEALTTAHRGETARFSAFCPTAKGTPKWWDVIVAPVRNAVGEFTRFVAVSRDMTESKRAEELLYERTALLQGLIESTPDVIWAKDHAGRMTLGNQATFDLLGGGTPEKVLGYSAVELVPDAEQARQILENDDRIMRNGVAEVVEEAFGLPDHRLIFRTTKAPLRNTNGEVVGIVGVSTDITERKQAEQALQQFNEQLEQQVKERTDELTKRLQELDQFAYVTSHDLKAPLRAIDHLAHWISEDAGALLPPKPREYLEKMHGRIVRMEKLLDDLLAYSRADRYKYTQEQVDLATLLDNIVCLMMPPEGFTIDVATPLPVLRTQKVALETVLRNLISNAIKHHNRSDGRVCVTLQDLDEFLEFSVRDDGPGIAPQYHERIFQVFQTLKPRDEVEGSGMGLAIVKKIVESRNGHITVTSAPGEGATFTFTWPKASGTFSQ